MTRQDGEDGPQSVRQVLRDMVADDILDDWKMDGTGIVVWRDGEKTRLDPQKLSRLASDSWRAARLWVFLETEHLTPGEQRSYPVFGDDPDTVLEVPR